MPIIPSKDASNLATAAEELIKAACSHVETTSFTIANETVEELRKISVNSESVQTSIIAMNKNLTELKEQMIKVNEKVSAQIKNQRLDWALENIGINSFRFYVKDTNSNSVESTGFVKTILMSFRTENGYYITNRSLTQYHYGNDMSEGEKQFREALTSQIHELIGHKPRIAMAERGHAIYYS
jgi:uncharacterized protein YycO